MGLQGAAGRGRPGGRSSDSPPRAGRASRICQRRMRRSYTIIHGGTRWNKQSQPSRQAARRGWALTRVDLRAPGQRTRPLRAPAARRTRFASAAQRRASRPCARRPSTPSCASSPCPASRRVRSGGSWREPARRGRGRLVPREHAGRGGHNTRHHEGQLLLLPVLEWHVRRR